MLGMRPLFPSPKFGEGMTSDTTDESGMNFSISRLALGIGRARCRLVSDPTDVNERNDMQPLKTGETTTPRGFSKAKGPGQRGRFTIRALPGRCNDGVSVGRAFPR